MGGLDRRGDGGGGQSDHHASGGRRGLAAMLKIEGQLAGTIAALLDPDSLDDVDAFRQEILSRRLSPGPSARRCEKSAFAPAKRRPKTSSESSSRVRRQGTRRTRRQDSSASA